MEFDKAKQMSELLEEVQRLDAEHKREIIQFLDENTRTDDILVVRRNNHTVDILVRKENNGWLGATSGYGTGTDSTSMLVDRSWFQWCVSISGLIVDDYGFRIWMATIDLDLEV